jgi:hypothetical protein
LTVLCAVSRRLWMVIIEICAERLTSAVLPPFRCRTLLRHRVDRAIDERRLVFAKRIITVLHGDIDFVAFVMHV